MNLFWHNRKVILSFLLLMCLIVGGCSERTGAKEETDALVPLNSQQIEYSSLYGQIMAEGDKGYYMLAGNFVFFAERDLSKAVPLCNKPNCRHYEETDTQKLLECNAFNRAVSVGWQDGKLYVVADNITSEGKIEGNVLMSVSPDGEGRKNCYNMMIQRLESCCIRGMSMVYRNIIMKQEKKRVR